MGQALCVAGDRPFPNCPICVKLRLSAKPAIDFSFLCKENSFSSEKVLLLSSFWKLEFLELGSGLLALTLSISTSVQCNVILWVGYLFIYLFIYIVRQTHFFYFQTLMNAASEHLSAEFILRASIPLDLTPANVNKASIAMDRIVLVRTSKFVYVHRSC